MEVLQGLEESVDRASQRSLDVAGLHFLVGVPLNGAIEQNPQVLWRHVRADLLEKQAELVGLQNAPLAGKVLLAQLLHSVGIQMLDLELALEFTRVIQHSADLLRGELRREDHIHVGGKLLGQLREERKWES